MRAKNANTFLQKARLKWIFFILFLLGEATLVFPSDSNIFIDPPKVVGHSIFGLNEGLPTSCLDEIVIDKRGRLWVNSCRNISKDLRLNFFQYDGSQSIFNNEPQNSLDHGDHLWSVEGVTNEGYLFGRNAIDESSVFLWHPDTNVQQIFYLGERQLLSMVANPSGGLLALYRSSDTYELHHLDIELDTLVGSIQIPNWDEQKIGFQHPFAVKGENAWFLHQRLGIVEAELSTGDMRFRSWNDWACGDSIRSKVIDDRLGNFRWTLFPTDRYLLFFLGNSNGFFRLEFQTDQLVPFEHFNEKILIAGVAELGLKAVFNQDSKKNLFIASGYQDLSGSDKGIINFQAIMLEQSGKIFDYTRLFGQEDLSSVLGQFYHRDKFFGSDFRRQLGWASQEGLTIMDLRPALEISNYQLDAGARSMQLLDAEHLLVNTDLGLRKLHLVHSSYLRIPIKNLRINGMTPFVRSEKDKIWMAGREKLVSGDIENDNFKSFNNDLRFSKFSFIAGDKVAIFADDGSVHIQNLGLGITRPYLHEGKPFTVSSTVHEVVFSKDSTLWVGAQNGLWKIDLTSDKIRNYPLSESDSKNILCIHEGDQNDLWLGTAQSGVLLFNKKNGTFHQVSEMHGLSNNAVPGILRDTRGNRWVSTFRGITVLSPDAKVLFEIQEVHGLVNMEFNRTSYALLPDGRMAFGGTEGIDILDPEHILKIFTQKDQVGIYLTQLEYFDSDKEQNIVLQGSHNQNVPINIPAANRYISLDFAMSEYVDQSKHLYVYRLLSKGTTEERQADVPWIDLGPLSKLTINNLPVGNHIVQVRGIDQKGNIVAQPLEVAVLVEEFFYRQWWFYVLCATPFFIGAFIWIRRIKGEQSRLEKEVARRTEQVQSDMEVIEEQAMQLQQLDQAKTRFFTNISHELRTPLTVILGLAEQIKDQSRAKDLIQRNADQLLRLINQILDLRKLEAGKVSTSYVQGDVIIFLRYFIESFHSLAEQKDVELKFESTEDSLVLDYDPEKLNHIVSNLLINAIKFTPAGGEVGITVDVHRDLNPPLYQFSVSDTGIGIPQDKLPHIFDRFFQAEEEVNHGEIGVGIGLSLVQELVKLLKGNISVQSLPGQGTTVTVMLPYTKLALPEQKQREVSSIDTHGFDSAAVESLHTQNSGKDQLPTLLIVEDNRDVTEYLITCLQEKYQLLFAKDGREGLEFTLEKMPDFIISDVMMPRMDGLAMCKEIKNDERSSHIPIILLTAKADIDSRITGLEYGADIYLAKPFHKKELQVQLRNLAAMRQRLRERYADLNNLNRTQDQQIQKEDAFILKVQNIILENINEEGFGVPELCKKIGMSRTQLHNKMKSLTNKPTSHFIRKVRMHRAAQLLHSSDATISQVAFEVGVDSLPYFTKIFGEEIGLSPSKYREKMHMEQ